MATKKQIDANRGNGKKGKGPTDTTTTRWNAIIHGMTAKGLTELDDIETYERVLADLTLQRKPVGPVEEGLVRFAALYMTKWLHAQLLAAEYVTSQLHPAKHEPLAYEADTPSDSGFTPTVSVLSFGYMPVYQRYESSHANGFFKTLNGLERIQLLRRGEYVPAPGALDVSVTCVEEVREESATQAPTASNLPTTTINVDDEQVATAAESEPQEVPPNGGNPATNVSVSDGSERNPGMSGSMPDVAPTTTINVDDEQVATAPESEPQEVPRNGGNPATNVSVSDGSAHNPGMSNSAPPAHWQKADPRPAWLK